MEKEYMKRVATDFGKSAGEVVNVIQRGGLFYSFCSNGRSIPAHTIDVHGTAGDALAKIAELVVITGERNG